MDSDEELEAIMSTRSMPKMRSNLAERIIDASQKHKAQGRSGFGLWFHSFTDALLLPKPSYVLAIVFCLGLFLGSYSAFVNADTLEVGFADFILTAEQISEGDWL